MLLPFGSAYGRLKILLHTCFLVTLAGNPKALRKGCPVAAKRLMLCIFFFSAFLLSLCKMLMNGRLSAPFIPSHVCCPTHFESVDK
eukprot:c43997_g1_i1 orf=61-318(+)